MQIDPQQLTDVSPAAWLAIIKSQLRVMSDFHLMSAIGEEAVRRFGLHPTTPLGQHIADIMLELKIRVRKPEILICKHCGKQNSV